MFATPQSTPALERALIAEPADPPPFFEQHFVPVVTVFVAGSPEIPPGAAGQLLSSPRITTPADQKATIRTGYPRLEYFERQADGSYLLRKTERGESPGVAMDVTASPRTADPVLHVDLGFALTVMSGRDPIAGTNLDVGRPIRVAREFRTTLVISSGEWILLTALAAQPAGADYSQHLLVFLKIDDLPREWLEKWLESRGRSETSPSGGV